MWCQQGGFLIWHSVDLFGVRSDNLDPHLGGRTCERRDGEEAAAIGMESLRLDHRPGPMRRADVEAVSDQAECQAATYVQSIQFSDDDHRGASPER